MKRFSILMMGVVFCASAVCAQSSYLERAREKASEYKEKTTNYLKSNEGKAARKAAGKAADKYMERKSNQRIRKSDSKLNKATKATAKTMKAYGKAKKLLGK